jgi:transcriptional regulator with XRE-family HTH domain
MGTKQRAVDLGTAKARSVVAALGDELRRAREEHGLSQAAVGRAAGISSSQVSRVERGLAKCLSIRQIARLLALVGLELSVRTYPAGQPIRDAAHRALLQRLRARVSPAIAWRFEVPLGRIGDQRAWDAVLLIGSSQVAVEAETRLRDVQALQRRISLKRRDDPGIASVILLLADTRHNRKLLREYGEAFRADLPLAATEIVVALKTGRDPGGSGVVLA